MKLFLLEIIRKSGVRHFQKSQFRLFQFEFSGTHKVHFSIWQLHRRQELLPDLLICSRMIHRAHYRGEAHRRNNANKPITSILRNRRVRQRGGARGTREGRVYSRWRREGANGEHIVRPRAATGSGHGQHAARMHARCIR